MASVPAEPSTCRSFIAEVTIRIFPSTLAFHQGAPNQAQNGEPSSLEYESLFSGLDQILRKTAQLTQKELVDFVKEMQKARGDPPVIFHLVGHPRTLLIASAFITFTLGVEVDRSNDLIVQHPTDDVPCGYSLTATSAGTTSRLPLRQLDELLDHFQRVTSVYFSTGLDEVKEGVQGIQEELIRPRKIAVIGRASAGKSTLLNALLGRVLLPTHHSICTGTVLEILGCKVPEEERVELLYLTREELDSLAMTVQTEDINTLERELQLSSQEFKDRAAHERIQKELEHKREYLAQLYEEHKSLPESLIFHSSEETPLAQVLKRLTVASSAGGTGVGSDLIKRARVHVACEWLAQRRWILLDTPGFGSGNRRHDAAILTALRYASFCFLKSV